MPGIRARISALAVAACALVVTACGDDDGTIPNGAGEQLLAQLQEVEDSVEAGDCATAQTQALTFADSVNELPSQVDGELRNFLVQASVNLEALTENPAQCEPAAGATGETGETTSPTSPTTTTDTTTTTTDEDDEAQEPPGGGGGDQGGGGGGGTDGGDTGGGGDDSSGGIGSGD